MDIFMFAAKHQLRFPSPVGDLTTEQLFDLPLTSATGKPHLDGIAKGINADLKILSEESFVEAPTKGAKRLEIALDVVKAVIADKIAERDRARIVADRADKRRRLVEALDAKTDEELKSKSREEILKELAELDAA